MTKPRSADLSGTCDATRGSAVYYFALLRGKASKYLQIIRGHSTPSGVTYMMRRKSGGKEENASLISLLHDDPIGFDPLLFAEGVICGFPALALRRISSLSHLALSGDLARSDK